MIPTYQGPLRCSVVISCSSSSPLLTALESLHDDAPRLDPPPARSRPTAMGHTATSHRNSSSSSHQSSTHRGRLNSDGGVQNKAGKMGSSNSSIDRVPVQRPPSPPPPYTEYDSSSHKGGSLSQQDYVSHPQNLPMSRTHSQGHSAARIRNRLSTNTDHSTREVSRESRDNHRMMMDGPMVPDGTLV